MYYLANTKLTVPAIAAPSSQKSVIHRAGAAFFLRETAMKKIPLTQGKFAIVDDADFEWLSQWKWCARPDRRNWYAMRRVWKNGKSVTIWMHRQILNTPPGKETDHINSDGLDNRRCNLRMCTTSQNSGNARKCHKPTTSKYKGVYWNRIAYKWHVQIGQKGKRVHLGYFDSEIEAAQVYDRAALKYFGEFANINF